MCQKTFVQLNLAWALSAPWQSVLLYSYHIQLQLFLIFFNFLETILHLTPDPSLLILS